jgi:hypothetical protein
MSTRTFQASEPALEPVTEIEFAMIEPGDVVRYQTKETGHRCGTVVGRDIDKKRRNSATKYLKNITAPLIVTIGVGPANRKKVSLTRDQLLEWRPNITTKVA